MNDYLGLLYARPSFLEGMGRAIDLGGTLVEYNTSLTPEQADLIALRSDIQAVRADLAQLQSQQQDDGTPNGNGE